MSVKCEVVQWTAGVFRHDSGVCHIVYGVGVVIEELCPSPLFNIMCCTIWYVSG